MKLTIHQRISKRFEDTNNVTDLTKSPLFNNGKVIISLVRQNNSIRVLYEGLGKRFMSQPIANINRTINMSSSYMDSYKIELLGDWRLKVDMWIDRWSDRRIAKIWQEAQEDVFNGSVEIDYPTAKERIIAFGKKYPEDRNDAGMMDLKCKLFRLDWEGLK